MEYEIDIKAIKEIMGGKDMSNIALANKIGVNRNTLRTYFKNPEKMPYEIILKIALVLDIPDNRIRGIFFKQKLTKNAS
ncbi:helix-turn-helix domain-containing protein [Ihubacter massiliensis]|uniref:helix-turn-helix domain-containing protein n=1 Tax=Ihubacter massiliensis TaxID=1852367 RepID=UPI002097159D|nr:helix-turn-helix transcriptional regulator [Ihubacter massiliensis]MCI7301481.1 helix-turn-helix domain-containing protein [Clostridia bacterium]MCO7120563.1 helix-turn-helix domain-containing protein [Ihubacter massiliensis]MDY3010630.1 helix-turn-helix transcriptional regulator [Clostridiales Family XIII bacterium]